MKKSMKYLVLIALIPILSGCSAMMAMHGKRDVDTASIRIGAHRQEVILQLGEPSQTSSGEDGTTDIFELQRGNAPSTGRAIGHVAMDLITLGWWEVIGVPVEALQGEKFTLTIKYGTNDRVTDIKTGKPRKF
jgi:outer membrane protein assembly factor BamE (lipoprotein component of BamABCDE complex)